jgi:hypothetical protein
MNLSISEKEKDENLLKIDKNDLSNFELQMINLDTYEEPINGWTTQKEKWFRPLLSRLKYFRVINNFHFFELKNREGKLSWAIIVISTFSSALSLMNTDKDIFQNSTVIVKWTLVLFTIITTLISAYIKKQQFIDKINNIDRYLQQLNQVIEEINITFILEHGQRENYDEFCEKYIPLIKNLSVFPSTFSPTTWKRVVYNITTKYPELIEGDGTSFELLWPWYHIIDTDKIEEVKTDKDKRKTDFDEKVINSYKYFDKRALNCFKV